MDVGGRCADGVLGVVPSYKERQARSWLQAGSGLHRATVSGALASAGNSQTGPRFARALPQAPCGMGRPAARRTEPDSNCLPLLLRQCHKVPRVMCNGQY